jgi:hypothetical protein
MLEDARGWAIFLVQPTCKTIGSKGYDRETIFSQLALLAFCCIASLLPVLSFVQSGKPSKSIHTTLRRTKANGTMDLMESTR